MMRGTYNVSAKARLSSTGTYMYLGKVPRYVGRNRICCLHVRTSKELSRKRASAVIGKKMYMYVPTRCLHVAIWSRYLT